MLSKRYLIDYPRHFSLIAHLTGAFIAIVIIGPIIYEARDRERPWTRLQGEIDPTHVGQSFQVRWHATPLVRSCPGTIQIEIISGSLIWPVLQRPVNTRIRIGQVDYLTSPWPLYRDVPPGPATYRVTTFWYCNRLQELLDWPIVQVGPEIKFLALPAEDEK